MRPLNNMFENQKNLFNFQFFNIYLPGQTIHHKCFQRSFCPSNAEHFGPKTYINFHLEVDDNFFGLI